MMFQLIFLHKLKKKEKKVITSFRIIDAFCNQDVKNVKVIQYKVETFRKMSLYAYFIRYTERLKRVVQVTVNKALNA